MKRTFALPAVFLVVAFSVPMLGPALGCGGPPKQASGPDPVGSTDEGTSSSSPSGDGAGSGGSGSGGSGSGGSGARTSSGAAPTGTAEAVAAPQVGTLEGVKFGMSRNDVFKVYNEIGGVIDKEYDVVLRKMQPGVQMKAAEAERDGLKKAFERSVIEFKDLPTGLDATGLRGEYTYRNRESMASIERPGKKRIFFFIGDRLWKVYDEVKLAKDGILGVSFQEASVKLAAVFGGAGKAMATDPQKGVNHPTLEWSDAATHMRAVDRSAERLVAVVLEDKGTLGNLAQLRSAKVEDPFAIDPSIAAATKGGISDPNAGGAPAPTATGKKPTPPKKK
jgi:hypothetical protein